MVDSPSEVDPPPSLQQAFFPVVEPIQGTQPVTTTVSVSTNSPLQQQLQQQQQQLRQQQQLQYALLSTAAQQQQQHQQQANLQQLLAAAAAAGAPALGPDALSRPLRPAVQPQLLRPPQLAQLVLPNLQHAQQQLAATPTQPAGPAASAQQHAAASSSAVPSGGRLPDSPEDPDVVKVSSRSRVSSVAGKIAHDVRDGRLPRIMVAGNHSISTATKAIVQARRYLRAEGQDVAFSPIFRSTDHSRALLELALVLMPLERGSAADNLAGLDNAGGHETRIASSSRHARAGSATAQQLRSRGISVLCSVGQDALANAVMACAHAGCFLTDLVGQQMVVQPVHVVLRRGDQDLHSIKLVVSFA